VAVFCYARRVNTVPATNLLSFSEKRLSGLLRKAALQHIRRELIHTRETLDEARFLLEWSDRPDWQPVINFVGAWSDAAAREREGRNPGTAPAAWIHLGQELADVLDRRGDWVEYLAVRWRVEDGTLELPKRIFYGTLAALALGLAGLIVAVLARHALLGHWDWLATGPLHSPKERILTLVLITGRVAGTVMMIEHGILWGQRALTGKGDEPKVYFLGSEKGLALVEEPRK
jgi:hypothetical protein